MSMTGGISFFDKSQCLYKDGSRVTASSNQEDANYAISMNRLYRWISVGSDDSTTETLVINFDSEKTFSRLWMGEHNLRHFFITYDSGQHFTNVKSLNGDLSNINENQNALNASYYEFDQVTASRITITMYKTQVANEEKFLALALVTNELGTLVFL